MMAEVGDTVTVFVNDRHDFTRLARVLALDPQYEMIKVRWINYDLPNEWIPLRWL